MLKVNTLNDDRGFRVTTRLIDVLIFEDGETPYISISRAGGDDDYPLQVRLDGRLIVNRGDPR
jgi:hypothetical protein